MDEPTLEDLDAVMDYPVTCARCGKSGMASEFVIEEGDEWECPPCWERCEAAERRQEWLRRNAELR